MRERSGILGVAAVAAAAAVFAGAGSPSPAGTAREGIPIGPNELVRGLWGKPYTGTKLRLAPDNALKTLRALRASGVRVTIKLVGAQSNYRNADGSFSLAKWKAAIDRFRGVRLGPFVRDGTIVAHQLVSEAKAPNQWGNTIIPNDVLDEMARYSKSIWPTMPTLVRTDALELQRHAAGPNKSWPGWRWRYLDAASPRYLARKQDASSWFRSEQASAQKQGLAVAVGLNVLSGGDGSSRVRSPSKPAAWAMSADEVRRYGTAAMLETQACAFEIWQYLAGAEYFARPEIAAAMRDLVALAAARPERSCAGPRRR